ncbi:MAG TPA: ABC transporter substrate-binding protein [Symbiobacteriaceae bacterium]|nr:ABC transporter substrate-binding protein [Symbiobacteriaceae bacterium]
MPVRPTCPYCGAALSAGARYCDRCGTPIGQAAGTPPPRRRTRPERRVAVWVFLLVLTLIFSAGTLGGYRFRSGEWPQFQAVQVAGGSFTLLGSREPNVEPQNPQATAKYLRSVVAISAKDQSGSGFIIDSKGHVVTANHVVDGTTCVTVSDDDGRQHQGTVLARDAVADVALLHVPGLETWSYVVEMATNSPPAEVGQEAYVFLHPRGIGSNMVTTATVTKLNTDQSAEGRYHKGLIEISDALVPRGHSGGPLVLKSTGKVIGMMLLSGDPTEIAWARPAADIVKLVQQWASLKPSLACQATPAARTIPLTLVTVTPRTGAYGIEGEELADGAELALREMEKDLKAVGYEVTMKREDDGGSPAKGREKAELAALDPKVFGIVGSLDTETTRSVAQALAASGLPVVAPTAGADDLTAQGWSHFNRVVARSARQNPVLAGFAKDKLKVSNVFILEDGTADAQAQVTAFRSAAAVIGLPISGTMKVSLSTDPADVKKRLAEARAEAVYYAGRSDLALHGVRTLRGLDVQVPFLGTGSTFAPTQFQSLTGPGAKGVYFTRLTAEPVDQFSRRYQIAFGKPPRGYAAYGFDAAYVMLDALRRYGETHPAQMPSHQELARLVRETRGSRSWAAPILFESNGDNQAAWIHVFEWDQGAPKWWVNL